MSKGPKAVHTSMRGLQINMEEMRTANETSVAVTGRGAALRMNARGDTLKNGGRVDKKREQIDQEYNQMPSGKTKRADVRAVEADSFETPQQVVERVARQNEAAKKPVDSKPSADIFTNSDVEPAKGVIGKDRARRLSEKDD